MFVPDLVTVVSSLIREEIAFHLSAFQFCSAPYPVLSLPVPSLVLCMPFVVAKIDKNDCVESFWRLLEWIQSPENTLRFLIVFREFNFASPHLFSLAKSFPGSAGSHCCCARALLSTLKPSAHHTSKMCAPYCTSHPRSTAVGTFGIDMPEMFHLCEGKGCVYFSC